MAGTSYTRQSTFDDGDVITAALFNNEYNQLLNAFVYASSGTTGHQHDGGAGEGGNIETIGDQDFLNKLVVDSTNNRWGFFVEVSSSAVEQIRIQDGAIVPVTDNDIDLGTSTLEFKDAFFDGTVTSDAFAGPLTGDVTGNVSGTAATVTTAAQSNITSLGTLTTLTVDNVIINGTTIGHTSDTDLITLASGIATVAGELSVTTLDIGGTNVTSTAAELNALDGITAVVGELNALDIGSTAVGTAVASKAVILDSSKDYTGIRNLTISGELDAATLDISGAVDVAGTTNLDAVDIDGVVQIDGATTFGVDDTGVDVKFFGDTASAYLLWDTSADKLLTAGGAVVDIVKDKLLIGGTAVTTTAAELNILDGKAFLDEDDLNSDSATGIASQQSIKAYVDSTVATGTAAEGIQDVVGAMLTGNTETGITVTYQDADGTIDLVVGTLNQDTTGTAAIATTVTITDNENTNENNAIIFTAGGDLDGGNLGLESDGDLHYNPSTGLLTATSFAGALTGNVTGNASGTAATVTGAAQSNITSLGTLTTLTVDSIIINGTNIGHTSDTDSIAIASNGVVTFSQIPVLPANTIDSDHYVDGSIDNAHIADDAIDSEHYVDGSIDNAHIADDAIDSEHYAAGSIDTEHIADNQITLAKMAGLARGKIIYGDSSGDPAALAAGSANYVLTSDGTDIAWAEAGGAYSSWLVKTANFTCADGDQLVCNHATTAFTITLPSGTTVGRTVTISNIGAATVTVGRNSQPINSTASDATLLTNRSTQLIYVDATIGWKELP